MPQQIKKRQLRQWAGWRLWPLVILLVEPFSLTGCGPANSEPIETPATLLDTTNLADAPSTPALDTSTAEPENREEVNAEEPSIPEESSSSEESSRSGRTLVEADDLVGFGEMGLLSSMLQTFDTGVDCDFDDALSTCQ